jgi:hypothetical protein
MSRFPDGWDPEAPGSRFTGRVAIAVLSRRRQASRFGAGEDSGVAAEVIAEAVGADALEHDEALGKAVAVDGADGRGASMWAPVLEWTLDALGQGVVGAAGWLVLVNGAARLQSILRSLRDDDVRVNVSRGAAALLAIHHVRTAMGEADELVVEAADEPSGVRGDSPAELNYVGIEPWIVVLVDRSATKRYIVVVSPDGDILGAMRLQVGEAERYSWPFPPRDQ